MAITTTVFRGLAFNIVVEEFHEKDACGHLLGYLASTYRQDKVTSAQHLLRRSRLPGAAETMKREIQRDGLQSFRRFALT